MINLGNSSRHSYRITIIIFLFFFSSASLFAQDYPTTKAVKGEGIYSLLKRQGLSPSEHLNAFIELNKNKLGPNNTLFAG